MKYHLSFHDILFNAIQAQSYSSWIGTLKKESLTKDLIEQYELVPQGLKWHPEFLLSKHVFLVSVSLLRQEMPDLLETAFLHDWGKIHTTNIGKNRIYSFNHEMVSLDKINEVKENLKFPDLTYTTTKNHMKYKSIGDKEIENNLYMKEFVKADKVMSEILFYEFFFQDKESNELKEKELFDLQENSDKVIYIPIGISGSGKSTYIRKNFDSSVIVSPDQIRKEINGDISSQANSDIVWNTTKSRLVDLINKKKIAVLDATNVDRYRRVIFMSNFNGCKKVALVFPISIQEAFDRVSKDIENNINRSNVPLKVIERQYRNLEKGFDSLFNEFTEVNVIE